MIKWFTIEMQGQRVRVPALKYQGRLWFHWQGQNHVVEAPSAARRAGGDKGKAHPGVISAPMPGKITRVNVAVGQMCQRGQALVVMEAMKMEYTLEADRDGQVQEVSAVVGKQVGLGDVLVRVGET